MRDESLNERALILEQVIAHNRTVGLGIEGFAVESKRLLEEQQDLRNKWVIACGQARFTEATDIRTKIKQKSAEIQALNKKMNDRLEEARKTEEQMLAEARGEAAE